jgi:hypothetical protein
VANPSIPSEKICVNLRNLRTITLRLAKAGGGDFLVADGG